MRRRYPVASSTSCLITTTTKHPRKRVSQPLFSPPSSHSPSFLSSKPIELHSEPIDKSYEDALITPQRLSFTKESSSANAIKIAKLEEKVRKTTEKVARMEKYLAKLAQMTEKSQGSDQTLVKRLDKLEDLLGSVLLQVQNKPK